MSWEFKQLPMGTVTISITFHYAYTVKQSRPKEERNRVVYEVPRASCDHVYIGETSRSLRESKNTDTQYGQGI